MPQGIPSNATTLQLPVYVPESGDFGAGLVAAILGLIAATGANPDDIFTSPKINHTVEPDLGLVDAFESGWQRFRKFYPALRSL